MIAPDEDVRVVLIHGLGQDSRIWRRVRAELTDVETVSHDIRGHGDSPLADGDGTLAQLGQDLIALLETVGPAVCVGFSLGGSIALWAAAERPDLVTGVAAIATSSVVGSAAARAMRERIELFESGDQEAILDVLRTDTVAQVANSEVDVESVLAERMSAIHDAAGYVNGARAVCSMRDVSLHDRLASIKAPVLVVSGERDVWCPRRAADIMLDQLPTGSFVELPDVGHLVPDDDPVTLAKVLREWLQKDVS
jgi:pimeloyl-ACP methyl ester carboxylesterase